MNIINNVLCEPFKKLNYVLCEPHLNNVLCEPLIKLSSLSFVICFITFIIINTEIIPNTFFDNNLPNIAFPLSRLWRYYMYITKTFSNLEL